jgi:predicted PhzF superfamily epimerase YddE/YHI9
LIVEENKGLYRLDFPSRMPIPCIIPEIITKSLNLQPKEVYKSRDFILVYDNETEIRNIRIDSYYFNQINLDPGGVCVTAKGEDCDFVSRFFTPQASILEDPVTGSAHCSLIPFWADRLQKNMLFAQQISSRMGKIYCENRGDRVLISGHAVTYSIGNIWID